MPKRCIWSNRKDPGTREVMLESGSRFSQAEAVEVCPAHEPRVQKFHGHSERYGGLFLGLYWLLVFAALILWALGIDETAIGGGVLICFGVLMVVFPFATPQTIAMIGVHASVVLVRMSGIGLFGWGVWLLASWS
jgi:hypothetical protein